MNPYPIQDNASFEALPGTVKAGFPSPADDFREKLDMVKLMVRHSGMDSDVSIVIPGYMERWGYELDKYQVNARFVILDTVTGYRSQYQEGAFIIMAR